MNSDKNERVLINRSTLKNIGNAIRNKSGSEATFTPSEMPAAINGIVGGGVGEVETLQITNKADFANVQLPYDGKYKSYRINVEISPANAPQLTRVILSNPNVASVVDNGDGSHSLRIKDTGQTTVTVTDYSGTVSDSFKLDITADLEDIYFPYDTVNVEQGTSRQLKLMIKPHFASNRQINWHSTHEGIVVNEAGMVTANTTGNAIITAVSPTLNKEVSVAVDSGALNTSDPDWLAIQAAVRAGNSPHGIGSELTMKWYDKSNNNKEYDLTFTVVDYDMVEKEDGSKTRAMILLAKNALPWGMNFASEQRVAVSPEESIALEGVHYYGLKGSTYTALNLQAGDVIAHELFDHVYKSGIDYSKNIGQFANNGLNLWKDSMVRQLLNSESDQAGFGFEPQHISDKNTATTRRGFLSGVSSSFLAALLPIKIQTMRNTVIFNGEVDVTYDRVFLPSMVQMGFTDNVTKDIEGKPFQYFAEMPTSDLNNARKRSYLGSTSSTNWWLRSAARGYFLRRVLHQL